MALEIPSQVPTSPHDHTLLAPYRGKSLFKVFCLASREFNNTAPIYKCDKIINHPPRRRLPAFTEFTVVVPKCQPKRFGRHAFFILGLNVCNDLPKAIPEVHFGERNKEKGRIEVRGAGERGIKRNGSRVMGCRGKTVTTHDLSWEIEP